MAASFHDIREELINNRVDTEDRKNRLKEMVADPMQMVGEVMFPELERRADRLEKVLLEDLNSKRYDVESGKEEAEGAVEQADDILAEMQEILQQMLDLETYNELLDIVRAMHQEHPELTFDFTAKVEHLLKRRDDLAELAESGCAFIVSAVESLSDRVLVELDKGHTAHDVREVLPVRDLLETSDLEPLSVLDGGDEVGGVQQTVMGAAVEPCDTAAENLNAKPTLLEVHQVQVCDLEFAALRRSKRASDIHHP